MQIISVVRDFEMYHRLVKENKFYPKEATFIAFDNNKENITIPKRYNSFLDSYDYSKEDWFVFCHEDWELKEDFSLLLQEADKNSLYGPIGTAFNWNGVTKRALGQIENSHRDGSGLMIVGNYCPSLTDVGTFDCQCLIVHSSLVQKHHLRFDEKLTWDLYVEDFCINARENFAVSSKILNFKCQHYSFGNVQDRFYQQYAYLQEKYKEAKNHYISSCFEELIGNQKAKKKVILLKKLSKLLSLIYQKKITKKGETLIKVFKIPVYKK
ncbi:MAG: hypothetical protein J6V53_05175 [Alphaproteobacteria bacterium]|nr:hypothetical protein [Alphaproteobacteria bacterium]